jgi:methylated-DNA-[protein]-cysteine S-methyltransferase
MTVSNTTALDQIKAGQLSGSLGFDEQVWALTARVPAGYVTTYRDIAHFLGTRAYRAVGGALHRNPHAPAVPCHRVVASSGHLNGFAGGLAKKAALLQAEGVAVANHRVKLARYHWPLTREVEDNAEPARASI